MAVTCNLVTLNVTAPTNCQVRSVPRLYLPISNRLNRLPTQGLEHHQFREHAILFNSVPDEVRERASRLLILLSQILANMTFALSSLLIILRVWVFCACTRRPIYKGGAHFPYSPASPFGTRIRLL